MKALIRKGEVLTEADWSPFVKAHLDWMQSSEGYTLVQDYVPSEDGSVTETETVTEEYVVVDGVKMTREEALRKLQS